MLRRLQKAPFCSISASDSNFNPRNTTSIPVVKIIAFLELKQKLTFFKGLVLGYNFTPLSFLCLKYTHTKNCFHQKICGVTLTPHIIINLISYIFPLTP
jgi:hypothetical protein